MANRLAGLIRKDSLALTIALIGNLHVGLEAGEDDAKPMGAEMRLLLRDTEIISLQLTHDGGTAWVCTPEECGVVEQGGEEGAPGVRLQTGPVHSSMIGSYHLGPIHASPPATQPDADATP